MESFWIAFNAVVPLFLLMGLGVFIRRCAFLTQTELMHLNGMLFRLFFFIMLFYNTYTADTESALSPRLMLYGAVALLVLYAASFAFVCAVEKDPRCRGAMIQGIYRSNFVILGIPLVGNLFGESETGIVANMISIIVPMYNVLGVFTLEYFRPGGKMKWGTVLKGLVKNPMIQGIALAVIFLALGVKLPAVLMKPLKQISSMTSPLALMVLGAWFSLSSVGRHLRQLTMIVVGRLIAAPTLVMSVAVWLGFRGVELVTLLAVNCTPCAVAAFTMAQQMDSDAELAGNGIIFTSGLSCVTIFLWVWAFKALELF